MLLVVGIIIAIAAAYSVDLNAPGFVTGVLIGLPIWFGYWAGRLH